MIKSEYSGIENCNMSQWLLQPTVLHPLFWHGYWEALAITHKIPNAACLCARHSPLQWNAVHLYYTPERFIAIYKVAVGSRTKDLQWKTDNLIYYSWQLQRAVAFYSITNSHFSKDSLEETTKRVIVSWNLWIPLCHHLWDGRKAEEPVPCCLAGKVREEAASSSSPCLLNVPRSTDCGIDHAACPERRHWKCLQLDHTSLGMFVFWDLSVSWCIIICKSCQESFVSLQQQLSQNAFPLQSKHWQNKSIFNPTKPAVLFYMLNTHKISNEFYT